MPINFTEKSLQDIQPHIKKGLILLVTATETETNALHEKLSPLPNENNIIEVTIENSTYYIGTFGLYAIAHVECLDMGSGGSSGSTITVINAIPKLDPKFVLMIGIAFGVDEKKQNIGDVLVSKIIIPYDLQRVGINENTHRGPRPEASNKLRNYFNNIRGWSFDLDNEKKATLELCDILSGEKLVDNMDYRDILKSSFPTAKGGEMEGSGLYAACKDKNRDWILVKAICDFADGNKKEDKDKKQALAMQSVLSACLFLFNKELVFNDYEIKPIISKSDKPPAKNFKKYFGLGFIGLIAICLPFFNKKGKQSNEDLSNSILAKEVPAINETDNTLALRLAEMAYNYNPSEQATKAFHEILSDSNSYFYQRIYEEHNSAVQSVVVSADGKKLLSAGDDGKAILRNFDGSERVDIPNKHDNNGHKGRILSTAISPNGQLIVTGGDDKIAKIWDDKGNHKHDLNRHSDLVRAIAFSHNGKYVVTGSYDSTVKIWNADSGKNLKTLLSSRNYPKGHKTGVLSVSFSPDDKFVITSCSNGDSLIRIWNWKTEKVVEEIRTPNNKGANSVAFSSNGNFIAVGAVDTVYLYDRIKKKGHVIGKHDAKNANITSIAFSCTGDSLITGSDDKTCILWNIRGDKLKTLRGHDSMITTVCFTPNSKQILTGSSDSTIKLWNIYEENFKTLYNHKGYIRSIAFLNDSIFLTSSDDTTAILWCLKRNKFNAEIDSLFTFKGHRDFVSSTAFINDSTILTASEDGTILKWYKSGKGFKPVRFYDKDENKKKIKCLSYFTDKKLIVIGNENEVVILNEKGEVINRYSTGSYVTSIIFTPKGKFIVMGCYDGTVRRWDYSNHKKDSVTILKLQSQVNTLCSRENEFIVGASKSIIKYSIEKMTCIDTIVIEEAAYTVAYSKDEEYFISGHQTQTENRNAFLWNNKKPCLKTFFSNDSSSITASTFSPDGKTIVLCSIKNSNDKINKIRFWRSLTDILDTSNTAALSERQKKRNKLL
jgi:WD40 repeat protein/nucleoside phosphorylase